MNKSLLEYIKKTSNKIRETLLFNGIPVIIKEALPENISLENVLRKIEDTIPEHLAYNVEVVYIGNFNLLNKKEMNAMYKDGAFYISNQQDDEKDLVDDIVHEFSHAVEERYGSEIYGDGTVEEEFISKRERLYEILTSYDYKIKYKDFMKLEYDYDLDMFLYKTVGYEKLKFFSMGLFPSSYSITSLKEYFGIGFEHYFLEDRNELQKVCPVLFEKIYDVVNIEEE